MNEQERATKFNGLVSAQQLGLTSNLLTRVPSLKRMGRLSSLYLEGNMITMIAAGDFDGATRLVQLTLGGNVIVSVAAEAFVDLAAFRVAPENFDPKNDDGTPFSSSYGIGALCVWRTWCCVDVVPPLFIG